MIYFLNNLLNRIREHIPSQTSFICIYRKTPYLRHLNRTFGSYVFLPEKKVPGLFPSIFMLLFYQWTKYKLSFFFQNISIEFSWKLLPRKFRRFHQNATRKFSWISLWNFMQIPMEKKFQNKILYQIPGETSRNSPRTT